jgi:TP901 family phage tail tape measure protein
MASKRIRGITIEIDGNTTKLNKALKEVDKTVSQTASKLRDIDKLLKFNPTSSELLRQKQQALGKEVEATREKLDLEQKALDELEKNADGTKENVEQQEALKREIIETTSKLKDLEKQSRQASSVFGSQMQAAGKKISATGDKIIGVGKSLSKVSAGFAALGGVALKAANEYEDGLNKVNTIAGVTGEEFEKMSNDLLKVSSATGKSAAEITEAAYQALSASVPKEQMAEFVQTSAKLAKAGFTETATAVDVLTTAINAYGLKTEEAESLANKLVQVQNDGKTTVDQLAASMGNVIPTASALGVNFDNLAAMYVLMTKQGINTKNATTAMRGTLNELSKSGSDVAKILKEETGKTFGQLMADGKDISDVLQILYNTVDGDSEAFKDLFGNVKAGQGALAIMNQGTDAFKESLDRVGNSAGNVDSALDTMSTPLKNAKKAINDTKNSAIVLGQNGLEALAPTIDKLSGLLNSLNERFQNMDDKQKSVTTKLVAFGAAIGPVTIAIGGFVKGIGNITDGVGKAISGISALLVKFGLKTSAEVADTAATTANTAAQTASATATTASGAAAAGASGGFLALNASMLPTILIIGGIVLAVAAVVTAIVLLIKNWDKVVPAFKKGAEKIKEVFDTVKNAIKTKIGQIVSFFSGLKERISSIFKNIGEKVGTAIGTAFKGAINGALTLAEGYLNMAPNAINGVLELINKMLPAGKKLGRIPTISLPRVPMAKGGLVTDTTNAIIGEGKYKEAVLPLGDPRTVELFRKALDGLGGGTVNQTINVGQMSSYREAYLIKRATEQGIKKMMRA